MIQPGGGKLSNARLKFGVEVSIKCGIVNVLQPLRGNILHVLKGKRFIFCYKILK